MQGVPEPFDAPGQLDYPTLLAILKQELKNFSSGSQTFSYQTACRYGPKDHDILAFQVRVLQKILDNIPHERQPHRSLAQLQVKNSLLESNMGILKSELNTLASKHSKTVEELEASRMALSDKEKRLVALMKKCDQFDRLGGKTKFEKLDQDIKEMSAKLAEAQATEKKSSDKMLELQRQNKLQKEINRQQETAIVDLQVENEQLKERLQSMESTTGKQQKQKQNIAALANASKVKPADLQTMALKQKLRQQSQLIDALRGEFENAKAMWLKKEQHYSKVVEKCFLKEEYL